MNPNQDLLDDEIGLLPPSTVDINATIMRQRRMVRAQRAGTAVAAGAVTVALGLTLALLPRTAAPPATQVGASAHPTASPTHTRVLSPREQEAARLTTELKALMAQVLPNAQFLKDPEPDRGQAPALVFNDQPGEMSADTSMFAASAAVKDSAGTGAIRVTVGDVNPELKQTHKCNTDPAPRDLTRFDCTIRSAPGAKLAMVLDVARGPFQWYFVQVLLNDDRMVTVYVANGGVQYTPQRHTPSLSLNQTIALANSPGLKPQL